ncbi:ankyrin repeat domain-containing protein [Candidatus Dependentiae bacterium]
MDFRQQRTYAKKRAREKENWDCPHRDKRRKKYNNYYNRELRNSNRRFSRNRRNRNTPLHEAIKEGDIEGIKKSGQYVFEKGNNGHLPIFLALICNKNKRSYDRAGVFKTLIDVVKGYYPNRLNEFLNYRDPRNSCPILNFAISKGCIGVVKKLIEAGVDITAKYSGSQTSLHKVIFVKDKNKREDLINSLLSAINKPKSKYKLNKEEFVNALGIMPNGIRSTVLHLAISQGFVGIAKKLIDLGADITARGSDGQTSLHKAIFVKAKNKREDLINSLLSAINKPKSKYALSKEKFLNALGRMSSGSDNTVLHLSITQGFVDISERLIEAGADITAKDSSGQTSLHCAIFVKNESKRKDLINSLLSAINKPKRKYALSKEKFLNALGRMPNGVLHTVLHLAISQGFFEIAKELIEVGADITARDSDGQTSLHKAIFVKAKNKREDLINSLLSAINKPKSKYTLSKEKYLNALGRMSNGKCDTVLHLAITQGFVGIAEKLIEVGADISVLSKGSMPALHKAVVSENIEMVKLVVSKIYKKDIDTLWNKNRTVLPFALRLLKGSPEKIYNQYAVRLDLNYVLNVFYVLLCNNASLDINDYYGRNVFHWALFGQLYDKYLYQRPESKIILRTFIRYSALKNRLLEALFQRSEDKYDGSKNFLEMVYDICQEDKTNGRKLLDVVLNTKIKEYDKTLLEILEKIKDGDFKKRLKSKLEELKSLRDKIKS